MDSPAKLVKEKINITEVVGQYVQLKKAGRNMTGKCPFHKERTPSFFVSPERGTYICFGCGEKGDVISFVEKMEGVDFKTALTQLAERAGVKLPKFAPKRPEEKEQEDRLRDVCEAATAFFEGELAKHVDVKKYLKERGLKDEVVHEWRLGYAPATWDSLSQYLLGKGFKKEDITAAGFAVTSEKRKGEVFDRFRGRIIFPIFDAGGSPIAVSGRFFEKVPGAKDEGEPAKYVNSPETELFKKSKVLYGYDRARNAIRKADCILLVEGQFDLLLSHQSGLPFTVALSGTALTEEHLALLSRLSKRLVLALDADAAGLRSGLKSARVSLAAGFDVKVPVFPEGKDPADVAKGSPEALKAAVRASQTAVEFFLAALRPQARDERAWGKLAEAQILPLIAAMGSSIDREHFIGIVAERLRVSPDAVRTEVGKASTKDRPLYEESASSTKERPWYSPLEHSAAMLLAHFGEDSTEGKRLETLLGRHFETARGRAQADGELLRFEFDRLGEEEGAIARALFSTLERELLEEELKTSRDELTRAEREGRAADASKHASKVHELSKRRQDIRAS